MGKFTVTGLNTYVNSLMTKDTILRDVILEAEIKDYIIHTQVIIWMEKE